MLLPTNLPAALLSELSTSITVCELPMVPAEVSPSTGARGPIPSGFLTDLDPCNVSSLSYIMNVLICTQTYCCLSHFKPVSQPHFCLPLLSYFSVPRYSNSHHELSAHGVFPSILGLTPVRTSFSACSHQNPKHDTHVAESRD